MSKYSQGRSLAYSVTGYMALVSQEAKEGDVLFALFGGSLLYLLRRKGDDFVLVSDCYVHGLMDGEAKSLLETGQAIIEKISIV